MNNRYNGAISFGPARSTHRNNGKVQLGITVSLTQSNITPNMANMATNTVTVQNVVPIQAQQQAVAIPVQLANGQTVYAQPIQMQPVYNGEGEGVAIVNNNNVATNGPDRYQ